MSQRTRRTLFDPNGPPLASIRTDADAIRLLLGLRAALDFSVEPDAMDGYACTQVLNQLHAALHREPIDIAEVCGILGVTVDQG